MPAAVHPAPQPSGTLPAANAIPIPRNQPRRTPSPETPGCGCMICCLITLGLIVFLVLFIVDCAISSKPKISIDGIAAVGLNTTRNVTLSPHFNIGVRVTNPSRFFHKECYSYGYVSISYSGVTFGEGVLTVFCQGPRKSTALQTVLRGSGIVLADEVRDRLAEEQRRGGVALEVVVKLPTPYDNDFVVVSAECQVVLRSDFVSAPCSVKIR